MITDDTGGVPFLRPIGSLDIPAGLDEPFRDQPDRITRHPYPVRHQSPASHRARPASSMSSTRARLISWAE